MFGKNFRTDRLIFDSEIPKLTTTPFKYVFLNKQVKFQITNLFYNW